MLGQAFEAALGAAYLADDCRDALLRRGIDVTGAKRLGTGYYGSAYLLKDGMVLKATEDESEATLAAWLNVNRSLPTMFPRILSVFQAKCSDKYGAPDYYIVREDLQNTSGPYFDRITGDVFDTPYIEPLVGTIAAIVDRWNNEAAYANYSDAESYEIVLQAKARDYANNPMYERVREEVLGPDFVNNVLKSLAWQKKNNVFVTDLHAANFGLRKHTNDLVVRDLGMSRTPTQEKIETLAGLRRGRVHGLRLKARRL